MQGSTSYGGTSTANLLIGALRRFYPVEIPGRNMDQRGFIDKMMRDENFRNGEPRTASI
jgi:hypothetical protein